MSSHRTLRLSEAPIGKNFRIKHLHVQPELTVRLREMGFCEDTPVTCVTRSHGNLICDILDTRVGLSGRLASDIVVIAAE
jgi:Fe2+ transport system protein FeoA